MNIVTRNKILVTADEKNLPDWLTYGKDYWVEFDGLGNVDIPGDDGIIHKCEIKKEEDEK